MNRNIKYIWNGMTYQELKTVIKDKPKIRSFPLVDNPSLLLPDYTVDIFLVTK